MRLFAIDQAHPESSTQGCPSFAWSQVSPKSLSKKVHARYKAYSIRNRPHVTEVIAPRGNHIAPVYQTRLLFHQRKRALSRSQGFGIFVVWRQQPSTSRDKRRRRRRPCHEFGGDGDDELTRLGKGIVGEGVMHIMQNGRRKSNEVARFHLPSNTTAPSLALPMVASIEARDRCMSILLYSLRKSQAMVLQCDLGEEILQRRAQVEQVSRPALNNRKKEQAKQSNMAALGSHAARHKLRNRSGRSLLEVCRDGCDLGYLRNAPLPRITNFPT